MELRHTLPNSDGAMVTTLRKLFYVAAISGGFGNRLSTARYLSTSL